MPESIRNLKFKDNRGCCGGGGTHSGEYTIQISNPYTSTLTEIVTQENLYIAWDDFIRGKRSRKDINQYALRLSDNLSLLCMILCSQRYKHGEYSVYRIFDPKKRTIHKASVQDRVVHRLIYNALYPYFDKRFMYDSYSCRIGKGTHKARNRFRRWVRQISLNYTNQCYVLKFDIKKCFASVDKDVLKKLLHNHVGDENFYKLIVKVIDSFADGLPLGNLTSQLFINIYLHELDHFIKHELQVRHYLRYADDMVMVDSSKIYLQKIFEKINEFIKMELHLSTHKLQIRSLYSGVDVLGEVFFAQYMRVRRSTERRAKRRTLLK